jgi:hypothetical protein
LQSKYDACGESSNASMPAPVPEGVQRNKAAMHAIIQDLRDEIIKSACI